MNELKHSILDLIKNDNYDFETLKILLNPVSKFINNPVFLNHLNQIIKVVLEDRDGNDKFTVNDLSLLSKDINGISALISALFLAIGTVQQTSLKYDRTVTEELVFKLLAYIFLVIIPDKTGSPLSLKEKEDTLHLVLTVYNLIMSAQITQDLIERVSKWFKKKGWCKCVCSEQSKMEIVEEHMPRLQAEISASVQKNKEINNLKVEVSKLKKQLTNL